jgi:hypothetical protein
MKKLMIGAMLLVFLGLSSTPVTALTRLATQFKGFDGSGMSTTATPNQGGIVIYDTGPSGDFFLHPGDDTIFITVTGTGFTANPATGFVNCTYDYGNNCNTGTPFDSFPGWTLWEGTEGVPFHVLASRSVVARWCVTGLDSTVPHNIQIRIAASPGGDGLTALVAAHFVIDSEAMGGSPFACTAAP